MAPVAAQRKKTTSKDEEVMRKVQELQRKKEELQTAKQKEQQSKVGPCHYSHTLTKSILSDQDVICTCICMRMNYMIVVLITPTCMSVLCWHDKSPDLEIYASKRLVSAMSESGFSLLCV